MTRHILFIIGSLVLIGALLGACGGAPATATPTAEAVQAKNTNLPTAAEGNLEPVQSATLNFTGSGLVTTEPAEGYSAGSPATAGVRARERMTMDKRTH